MTSHAQPRRSRPGRRTALRWTAVLAAVAAAAAGLSQVPDALAGGDDVEPRCLGPGRVIEVAVTPEVRTAVADVATALNRFDAQAGLCRRTKVTVETPAVVATRVRSGGTRPDVWVPDSSLWLSRAASRAAWAVGQQPSIARTPVVFAVRKEVADGVAVRGAGLAGLVASAPGTSVRLGLPQPDRSAVTAGALLDLQAAVARRAHSAAAPAVLAATLRRTDPSLTGDPAALLDTVSASGDTIAVAVTEQAVAVHNAASNLDAQVEALRPEAGGFALDFPVLAMIRQREVGAAALRLLAGLQSPFGQQRLLAAGLQTPEPDQVAAPSRTVEEAVRTYLSITRGARMLAVFDVSGSMGQVVPDAGGATRMDLARRAAAAAMPLLPPDSRVGLWEFSTDLTARSDHRELFPVGPVAATGNGEDRSAELALAVAGLQQIADGGTGLYDTTLAAVRAVRRDWDPDRVNSVVLLTDGRNDDPDGIDLTTLLRQLKAEADALRPVPVVSLVYGPDADAAALRAISGVTGGAAYVVRDPRRVGEIMLDAFGRRACEPEC
jgi:Ca-activated chloride channel family protein